MAEADKLDIGIRNVRRDYDDENVVGAYDDMQPDYPAEVREEILRCLAENAAPGVGRKFMIDVGCGGGKSTKLFVRDFEHILGIDISQSQIEFVRKQIDVSNTEFQLVHDNILPAASNCADLVLCGISFHYLDPSVFLPECNRVLVNGGILSCLVYDRNILRTFTGKLICDLSVKDSRWAQLQREYAINCGADEAVADAHLTRYEDTYNSINNPTKRRVHLASLDRKSTVIDLLRLYSTIAGYSKKTYTDKRHDPLNIFRTGLAGIFRDAGLNCEDDTEFVITYEFSAMIVEKTDAFGIE